MDNRGRPKSNEEVLVKRVQTCYEVPTKPELGYTSTWYFDLDKTQTGPYKVEHSEAKGYRHPTVKPIQQQRYGKSPVVMVFKTSNRSNAKTKMKIWKNTNIDYINTQDKLAGVPDNAPILELGVGESLIERWKKKYKI